MSDPEILHISFVDAESQTVAVTLLRPNVYRLEWTPLIIWGDEEPGLELYLGDIIETQMQADGTLRFLRVLERSQFRHYDWLVPKGFLDSVQCTEFGDAVEVAGGRWEGLMGGWLLVHVPFASPFDVETELNRCIATAMNLAALNEAIM